MGHITERSPLNPSSLYCFTIIFLLEFLVPKGFPFQTIRSSRLIKNTCFQTKKWEDRRSKDGNRRKNWSKRIGPIWVPSFGCEEPNTRQKQNTFSRIIDFTKKCLTEPGFVRIITFCSLLLKLDFLVHLQSYATIKNAPLQLHFYHKI